jgi:adenosylcobalamin-dependent ribonucleoside-triphosphate reductase
MQKEWILNSGMAWNNQEMENEAKEMFDRMFHMKFLPPGRGLWAMGTELTTKRKLYAALNNCAFVSTSDMSQSPTEPFCFLMDASMLGVGVGFDTKGAGTVKVADLSSTSPHRTFIIPDSREGWVESVRQLLSAYLDNDTNASVPIFDYSLIRPAGEAIKGFGGTSQGSAILQELHVSLVDVLRKLPNQYITVTAIVDIMNLIGRCVVAGNVRRTAEISFGDPYSLEYISLKDYTVNPHRASYGWTSNNSIFATLGMDYNKNNICKNILTNGEPGFAWLENMQKYGRMVDGVNNIDIKAQGGNPCLEQTLESFEMCCLVETFPNKHVDREDYKRTLRFAMIYAKTVTLGSTQWSKTNQIMKRNRRIGTSMSGLAQFLAKNNIDTLREWCESGYKSLQMWDKEISDRFGIPRSIKTTCIKPSGTVSLLAGASPGMHFPESRFYIRRVRIVKSSHVVESLKQAGYKLEDTLEDNGRSVVVEFPVDVGDGVRTLDEVSMWEQLSFASFLQRYWADNQVCIII